MYSVSENYLLGAKRRPYIPSVSIGGVAVDPEAVENMDFSMGAWDSREAVSFALAVSAGVEIRLRKDLVNITAISGKKIEIQLGQTLGGVAEYAPMGAYYAIDAKDDEGIITITASDAVGYKMDKTYTVLEGVDFAAGVSAQSFAVAMANHLGVEADLTNCADVPLTQEPVGYTWRQCWAMLAALSGCFVYMDRHGVLCFGWYKESSLTVTPDMYYADGLEKADNSFTIQWLRCYTGGEEEKLLRGDESGAQGVEFECIWMTDERMDAVWNKVGGFSYRAVPQLRMMGDVRPDIFDVIGLQTTDGETVALPVAGLRQEFDGGLSTTITASGKAVTTGFRGNVSRESTNTRRQINRLVQTVKDVDGRVSEAEQLAGQVKLTIKTEKGVLETKIMGAIDDPENPQAAAWEAKFTDNDGNVQSGFNFDFEYGQFRFDGSGQFWSQDRNSYIMMDGEEMVLYRKKANGFFVQTLRMGASALTDGNSDNSYILMGVGTASSGGLGLMKRFDNGLWFGNSYPIRDTGIFTPQPSYTGIFVDVWDGKTYSVTKGVMTQIYAGISTARFG